MVPLEYLSNFRSTLELHLINCEVDLILTWSVGCLIISTDVANQVLTFTVTETNLYVTVVTLSTQDNAKLLPQLKSGSKRTISCYWLRRWLYNWLFVRLYLFQNYYKVIAVDFSKQQALDANPKAIQQINFTANLDGAGRTRFYYILEEAK